MSHPTDVENMTQEQKEYYSGECVFCLNLVEPPYPDVCPACMVVRCEKCLSFIPTRHGPAEFCHGCGTVLPVAKSAYSRISSTGCVYMEDAWMKRNKGRESDGDYSLGTGYIYKKPDGSMDHDRIGIAVSKRVVVMKDAEGIVANLPPGSKVPTIQHEDVRILSEEEVEKLKEFREKHRKK
jgi:hypothetical protein